MSLHQRFSPAFLEWVATAGRSFQEDDGALVLANAGGELRYYLRGDGADFALTFAERSEREVPVLWSSSLNDVERYLSADIGQVIRVMTGLPRIHLPWRVDEVAQGFSLIDLGGRRLRLESSDGSAAITFYQHGSPEPAVTYSYYADSTPADIRASYADPAGLPLFGAWLEGRDQ